MFVNLVIFHVKIVQENCLLIVMSVQMDFTKIKIVNNVFYVNLIVFEITIFFFNL